ncbi:hypothetical protein C7999DRAFT_12685 [Corynascus novoguineensis]|uniref:Uncharacterized protein n=1 Tax=Corynascus novoguineensis TaxID=1126955 RepID=A0AAN7CWZ9_9PEZI|nr:hypothetical protein C7999DRAFT_12685 [Corynascus novoguineensis]
MSASQFDMFTLSLATPIREPTVSVQIQGNWSNIVPSGERMEIDFSFEGTPEMPQKELPHIPQQQRYAQWSNAREKRFEFQHFRVWALRLQLHQRYMPLLPSPLRNAMAASELPDTQLSDVETVDDPLSKDTALTEATSSELDYSMSPGSSSDGSSSASDEPDRRRDGTREANDAAAGDPVTSPPPPSPTPSPQ